MTPCIHRGMLLLTNHPTRVIYRCNEFNCSCTEPSNTINMRSCTGCPKYETLPLVSAVCLAYDLPRRLAYLNEAVESFMRQDWPNKELVIVVDTPGLVIETSLANVRVITVPTCPTLGDKYNSGVESANGDFICSWDDDDISLPTRMSHSVEMIGIADYYNPQGTWAWERKGTVKYDYPVIGHNAAMFRRSAWEKCGRYPSVNGPQDVRLDTAMRSLVPTVLGVHNPRNATYIVRYDDGMEHLSTNENTDAAFERLHLRGAPGTYRISPKWQRDYSALVANALEPGPRLTIGMATYRDWQGVWATIQSLRLNHSESAFDIVVVDNDLQGRPDEASEANHSFKVNQLCQKIGAKYEHFTKVSGTAAAKGRIFELAKTPAVLVIDCHVILPSGTVKRLIDWFDTHPASKDLWQGPCIGDGGINDIVGTHFRKKWGGPMYGQWEVDTRVKADEPFEIPMMGCGLFACLKSAWPGFHPLLRGFGPEEWHIHERVRRNGGKCYCLPWLKWSHRFGNPGGAANPGAPTAERLRGHIITMLDTRSHDVDEMFAHWCLRLPEKGKQPLLTPEEFRQVLKATTREFFSHRADTGLNCQHRGDFLRVVDCEIGCTGGRKPLPVFQCDKHGECSPYRWQSKRTMAQCLECADNTSHQTIAGQPVTPRRKTKIIRRPK